MNQLQLQLPDVPESFKPKSFWNRKEGNTGIFALAIIIAGAGIFISLNIAAIIALLQNIITAGILFGVIALVAWAISNKSFRWMISNMFKSAMRLITGIWTTVDPLGILQNFVDLYKEGADNMAKQIENLRKQLQVLYDEIKRNDNLREKSTKLAIESKKRGANIASSVEARKAVRKGRANIALADLAKRMELLLRVLRKFHEIAVGKVADLEDEVETQTRQRKMILSASAAFRSGLQVINPSGVDKEGFDRAMDYLVEDNAMRIGEISNFVEMSEGFLQGVDVENAVCDEEFLRQLEEWENKSDSILLDPQEKNLLVAQANSDEFAPEDILSGDLPNLDEVRVERREKRKESMKFLDLIQ